jgi:hypothetical protein
MATPATWLGGATVAVMAALVFSAPRAQAGYIVTLQQVGNDVVASGNGAIDLTGLTSAFSGAAKAQLSPFEAGITTGPATDTPADGYDGISGPKTFGGGSLTIGASSGSGDVVTIVGGGNLLGVPHGYLSGTLSDTSTYDNQTFAGLGVNPGVYEWTWGRGPNQNFTLVIGEVPEPTTWAMLLVGFAGLGFAGYRARKRPVAVA